MDGQTQVKDAQQVEDDVPDYEIIEEGSPEAKEFAKGGQVDDEDDVDDQDDLPDEKLTRQQGQDKDDVNRQQTSPNAQKRQKQRQRLKEKLDAKDALTMSLRQENQQLNERLSHLENRTGSNEIAMIDKAISDTRELVSMAEQSHAHSLTQNDPMAVTRSMRELFNAENRLQALVNTREQAVRNVSAPRATDANVNRNVNAWMARNPWFRPETGDHDSKRAKLIDDEIAAEGFNPGTPAYWQELDRRIKRELPHRAGGGTGRRQVKDDIDDDDDDDFQPTPKERQQRQDENRGGSSKVSGSGQGAGGGGRVKVTLSRERIQALKDAGKYDDPVERNKMIKAYVKYDRENTNRN